MVQELTNSITETVQELINSFTVRELTLKYSFFTTLFKTILLSFLWYCRNVNPIMPIFRDGKFSTHHSRLFSIPHSWFSSCGKIKIPHSRLCRSWGIFISPRLLNHSWGIGNCLSWFVKNFQFLTRGFAARSGIIPSLQISIMGLAQSKHPRAPECLDFSIQIP